MRPARAERVVSTRAGESVVLLDPEGGTYFTLTEVGARIWELCDGTRTVDDVVTALAAEYEALEEVIRADILELLAEMEREKLMTLSPE